MAVLSKTAQSSNDSNTRTASVIEPRPAQSQSKDCSTTIRKLTQTCPDLAAVAGRRLSRRRAASPLLQTLQSTTKFLERRRDFYLPGRCKVSYWVARRMKCIGTPATSLSFFSSRNSSSCCASGFHLNSSSPVLSSIYKLKPPWTCNREVNELKE